MMEHGVNLNDKNNFNQTILDVIRDKSEQLIDLSFDCLRSYIEQSVDKADINSPNHFDLFIALYSRDVQFDM